MSEPRPAQIRERSRLSRPFALEDPHRRYVRSVCLDVEACAAHLRPLGQIPWRVLFCAVGVTLLLPCAAVRQALLVAILGFTVTSLTSRAMFLLAFTGKRAPGQDSPGPWRRWGVEL